MLLAILAAVLPVAAGVTFALAGLDRRALAAVRIFAFAAALAVVLVELLPDAVAACGAPALLVFGIAFALPLVLDRLAHRLSHRAVGGGHERHAIAVELAFAGLVLHQAVEGVQVGAAWQMEGGGAFVLAVAAHTVPLVAAAVLGYAAHDGPRPAFRRALVLAAVTGAATAAGWLATAAWLGPIEPWLRAVLAGLLLHLLGHDLAPAPPRGWLRWLDGAALVFGAALPLLVLEGHGPLAPLLTALPARLAAVAALAFAAAVVRKAQLARRAPHHA